MNENLLSNQNNEQPEGRESAQQLLCIGTSHYMAYEVHQFNGMALSERKKK
jgi:hypothetical protein